VHAASVDNGLLVERLYPLIIGRSRRPHTSREASRRPAPPVRGSLGRTRRYARPFDCERAKARHRCAVSTQQTFAYWTRLEYCLRPALGQLAIGKTAPSGRREGVNPSPLIPRGPSRAALTLHPHSVRRVEARTGERGKPRAAVLRGRSYYHRTRAPPRQPPPLTTKSPRSAGLFHGP